MIDRARTEHLLDKIDKAPPAQWVREMAEHFDRTGTYRPEDIRRVMGDQTEGVKFSPDQFLRVLNPHAPVSG